MTNRISSLLVGLMVVSAASLPMAFAQDNASPDMNNGVQHQGMHHHCEMMNQLGLTEQQKQQLKDAHKAFQEQNKAAIDSLKDKYKQLKALGKDQANQAQRQQLLSQIKQERTALMEKRKASMQGILTPEQQAKWETLKQQCKAQHAGKYHHGDNDSNKSQTPGG